MIACFVPCAIYRDGYKVITKKYLQRGFLGENVLKRFFHIILHPTISVKKKKIVDSLIRFEVKDWRKKHSFAFIILVWMEMNFTYVYILVNQMKEKSTWIKKNNIFVCLVTPHNFNFIPLCLEIHKEIHHKTQIRSFAISI